MDLIFISNVDYICNPASYHKQRSDHDSIEVQTNTDSKTPQPTTLHHWGQS